MGHCVQQSGTITAILVESYLRVLVHNYFKIHPLVKKDKSFKNISIFSFGDHLVQRSEIV